ncbi:MAG TPA: hypothetical protein DCP28_17570, partial [Cytophagales bacterium]|nr:hypothetical protein [Cytophagales bacterium]
DGQNLDMDAAGNIYVAGSFYSTADFDPGPSTVYIASSGGADAYIAKLTSAGDYVWAKKIGGSGNDIARTVQVKPNGDIVSVGYFSGTVDFDPGSGTVNRSVAGGIDFFTLTLDADGNYREVITMGGSGNDGPYSVEIDDGGNMLITGNLASTFDADPGAGTTNLSFAGVNDIFVGKYGIFCTSDSVNTSLTLCPGDTLVFGSQTLTASGSYTNTFTKEGGCDSLVNLTLVVEDVLPPTLVTKNTTLTLDVGGTAILLPDSVITSVSDNCTYQVTLSRTAFTCTDLGDNSVIVTAVDGVGNVSSDTVTVIVDGGGNFNSPLDCGLSEPVMNLPLDSCSGITADNTVGAPYPTTYGATGAEGYTGQGLYFDGKNDYVNVGTAPSFDFDSSFSLALWVNSLEDGPMFLMGRNRDTTSFSWALRLDNGVPQLVLGGLSNPGPYAATTDVTDGTWHHLAVTYRTGQANLYVDGQLERTYATPLGNVNANSNSSVWLGMRNDKPNERQFKGYLDNVQAYGQPLTPNQVAALASEAAAPQGCTAPTTSLVGYWTLDDCYSPVVTNGVGMMSDGPKVGDVYHAAGYVGQAAYFDGDQDHIDLRDTAYTQGPQDAISYSLWVFPTNAEGNREVIIRRVEPAGASVGIFLTNLTPEIYLGGLAGSQYHLADSTLPLNTWSHLGVTYGDGALRVYRNGTLILNRDNLIGALNFSPDGKHALGGNPNGSRSFSGRLDEVRIFNEALFSTTMASEASLVSSSPADCGNLAEGAWLFDDCASPTVIDSLGNHGGTIVGATRGMGYRGAGMSFDGVNDYINLGSDAGLNLSDEFTISMWVNTTQNTRGTLLIKNPQAGSFSYAVQLDNGVPLLALGNGVNNPGPFSAAVNVADGTWYHLAWTFARGTVTTYVDGVAQSSTS